MTASVPSARLPYPKLPIDWPTVVFMAVVHLGALLALLPGFRNGPAMAIAFVLYFVTGCLGVTLGYHRLISHRSFRTPQWLEYLLLLCGTLSCQHGPITWVGLHRHHHRYSDQDNDHHDSKKGFLWSHLLWMFHEVPAKAEVARFTGDIATDPVYRFCERWFLGLQLLLAVGLYAWGQAWVGNGWSFVLWGVCLRLVVVYHVTWFVNSATHRFGYQTYESGDCSRNCWWVALLAFGEGWHNNHHAFPSSARHGLQWWELDLTWGLICLLRFLGLATRVRLPRLGA